MENDTSNIYTFATSSVYVSIVNNSGKVGLGLALIQWFVYLGNQDKLRFNVMLICLGITIAFPFFFGMTQRNFVHKVVVDFNKSILSLSMFRSNKIITASFDDIEKIYIKGYIVFKLPGRKVYCNSAADHKLIACLNKIMLVS